MSATDRVWSALTSMIKLEDKVSLQAEALKTQQSTGAAMIKKLKGD